MKYLVCLLACCSATTVAAQGVKESLPLVPPGFVVDVVAAEPLVRNPSVMAFDQQGRLFIGQGPQWRAPTRETAGDRVDLLIDDDGDGIADRVKTYADGFNCIQGLAWRGDDLWVANSPDLTIVRDVDGDDQADVYLRVYTGLGNLEHALHGLNFGPDGKLYMSKGNSRGYNRLDQLAPKAFRELWGLPSPEGAPDYTPIEVTNRRDYRRAYHTPEDDWGQQGGILRCDPDGRNLEIVARGFRNPWDIAFDEGFNWLGTDNDQTLGDKIFSPFYGAHFGWGHAWSFDWAGEGHLPTVPASAPLFEGSGTGVTYYPGGAEHFPSEYANAFFVNDWLKREVYLFRPRWEGGLLKCESGSPVVFAQAGGGRSLAESSGRAFDPTDIEVGPDGALYVLSWGHAYGSTFEDGQQQDIGRVYRIRYASRPLVDWRAKPRNLRPQDLSLDDLLVELGSHVPSWRINAQDEVVRRVLRDQEGLPRKILDRVASGQLTTATETWAAWAVGRASPSDPLVQAKLVELAGGSASENLRIQAIRILGFRARAEQVELPVVVIECLRDPRARIRHEAVLAIHQAGHAAALPELLELCSREDDRVIFYSAWQALRGLAEPSQRRGWVTDTRPNVRLAAFLGLFEDDGLEAAEVENWSHDPDSRVAGLIESWLARSGTANPLVTLSPPPGIYTEPIQVTLACELEDVALTYTLDGSTPVKTSPRYQGPITVERDSVLRVAIERDSVQTGAVISGAYRFERSMPFPARPFIRDIKTPSGRSYRVDWAGLATGKPSYTDRNYRFTQVPAEIAGWPYLLTANDDDRSSGDHWLSFTSTEAMVLTVGVDVRIEQPLAWMKVGERDGFQATDLRLVSQDATFRLYRKAVSAGTLELGGNTHSPSDSARGNYVVIFERKLLQSPNEAAPATVEEALDALATADEQRGRELFLHARGAGCYQCHRLEGRGSVLAPDLSDIGTRVKEARVIIESILEPSAQITEGFAQQRIVTTDGAVFSGAVLEETGRALKLVDSDGKVTTLLVSEVEERVGTKISPMPAGFGRMLTAQQIADITAWLLTQRVPQNTNGFSFRDQIDSLEIYYGKQRIGSYLKRHSELTRRALVNVTTPGGIQVTRNFPPRRPEDLEPGRTGDDAIIHPRMHPGIWISFGDLNGNDYWRLAAEVRFEGYDDEPIADGDTASFTARNTMLSEDGSRVVCTELSRYSFERVAAGIVLVVDVLYQSDDRDFYFGDQEESGLAFRIASPLRVTGGNGTILNDRQEKNGGEIWGKEAKWVDYSGVIDSHHVGLLVAPSPSNPRPSWLHARDYGVVAVNPFPKQPRERREPYVKTWIKKGEPLKLSYGVLIYETPSEEPLDRPKAYQLLLERLRAQAAKSWGD